MNQKTVNAFVKFLQARGAEILKTTNEWELIRFYANGQTSIIYKNRAGGVTYTGEALKAFQAYHTSQPWACDTRKHGRGPNRPSVKIRTLLARDGDKCFFCGDPIPQGEESIEHLLPLAHGGTHHISNLALAHGPCNQGAGHLSIIQKIALRESRLYGRLATV